MANESFGHSAIEERAVEADIDRNGKSKTEQKRLAVFEGDPLHDAKLGIAHERLCQCGHTHTACRMKNMWYGRLNVWMKCIG